MWSDVLIRMLRGMLTTANIRLRRALPGGRPFHLLLTGLTVSACGDWLYNVALVALVIHRTGSPTWTALTTAARVAPIVVFGPLAGVLADRYDRRRLMLASDLVRALVMVALALVATAGIPIVLVPLLAAAATVAATVQMPCVAASTARLVAATELQRANAVRAAIGQLAVVVGPALGAVILMVGSPVTAILLNAVTFICSASAIAAIRPGAAFRPTLRASAWPPSVSCELKAGAQALRGAPAAVKLVAADVVCSGVYGLLSVTLVLVGRRVGAGSSGYGLLLFACGIGGLIGAYITGRTDTPSRWRGTTVGALLLVAAALAALGLTSSLIVALALASITGGGMIVGEILSETALPRMLDHDVLASAYGLTLPLSLGAIVVGSLLAAPLVSLLGLQGALESSGLFVLLLAGLLFRQPLEPGGMLASAAAASRTLTDPTG
jgi:predicted MFS family arabinose efflux permease